MSSWEELARTVFGHKSLRPAQLDALRLIESQDRALITLPTGSGKSLLYGLTALAEQGTTIVVCPLTALKREQAALFRRAGLAAAHMSFDQSRDDREAIWQAVAKGELKLLFVSPERFTSRSFLKRWHDLSKQSGSLARVFVDEAHCMASWGYDFRPEYRRIGLALRNLGVRRVVALTATASLRTRQLICQILAPMTAVLSSDPIGRHVRVEALRVQGEAKREEWLKDLIGKLRAPSKIIVYVQRRRDAERLTEAFRQGASVRVACYHAGLGPNKRVEIEQYIQSHDGPLVVVATQAFGMGINLSDVERVVVCGFPSGIEELIQMLGRAGRRGTPAAGTLLWTGSDPIKRLYGLQRGMPFATSLPSVLKDWRASLHAITAGVASPHGLRFVRLTQHDLETWFARRQHSALQPVRAGASAKAPPPQAAWTADNIMSVLRLSPAFAELVPGEPVFVLGAQQGALVHKVLETLEDGDSQRRRVLAMIVAAMEAAKDGLSDGATSSLDLPVFLCLPLFDVLTETRLGVAQLERVASVLSSEPGMLAAVCSGGRSVGATADPSAPEQAREFLVAPFALDLEKMVERYRHVRDERMRGFDALDLFARAESCRMQGVLRYFDGQGHDPCGHCDRCCTLPMAKKNASRRSTSRNQRVVALDGS